MALENTLPDAPENSPRGGASSGIFGARLQVVAAALLFSTGGAAVKATALGPWQIAGFRCLIAALVLVVILPATRRRWSRGTLVVAVAYALTLVLYVLANRLTTATNSIFLQYTAPLYVLLLSPWLLGERIRRRDGFFMLALAAGMVTIFLGVEAPLATATSPVAGNVVAAVTGLTWGLTLLGLRQLEAAGSGGAPAAVLAGNGLAFLMCLPFMGSLGESVPGDWLPVIYLGVVQIALAYVFLTRALRHVRALEVSLLLLLELLFSPFWAWLLHGEMPGSWAVAGCGIILLATLLWTLRQPGGR